MGEIVNLFPEGQRPTERPKSDHRMLVDKEITAEEYVERLKARVDERLRQDREHRLAKRNTHQSVGERLLRLVRSR